MGYTYGISGTHYTLKQGLPKKICVAKIFWEKEQPLKSPRRRKAVRIKGRVATQCATLCSMAICFAPLLLPKFFSTLCIKKHSWKKLFQLVSDFISLPPSFCFTLRFCSYESTKDKLSLYLIWTFASRFVRMFRKSFLFPHYNWKVTSRLLGYFTKILQKNCREFFPTTAYKKEVRYNSNFLFLVILSNHFWHIGLTFNT